MLSKLLPILLCVLLLTSCFALPVEESVPPPPILAGGAEVTFRTTEVARGGVRLTRELSASYVAAREESPSFDINDEYITDIYIDIGDTVEAGDIIAEIDNQKFQDELTALDTEEAWVRLDLAHAEESFALQLEEAGVTGDLADDSAYVSTREELGAKLNAIQVRREYLQLEIERRKLRAGLSGIVTYSQPFSEGLLSVADKTIATIADQSESVFMVRGPDSELLRVGQHYDITIDYVAYDSVVVDPAEVGVSRAGDEETYMVIVDAEQPVVTSRTFARVMMVLDEKQDVINIPSVAVKKANDRVFVYVLEDGVRSIRDVETGMEGNANIEIISGLAEGESVIID